MIGIIWVVVKLFALPDFVGSLANNIKSFIYIPYFVAFIYKGGIFCGKLVNC